MRWSARGCLSRQEFGHFTSKVVEINVLCLELLVLKHASQTDDHLARPLLIPLYVGHNLFKLRYVW
jgi:hypothetical protein